MSEWLRHEPCPKCGSRDNLGVWDDHKWCFGCGYWEGDSGYTLDQLRLKALKYNPIPNNNKGISNVLLPADTTGALPDAPRAWLEKYGITEKERIINHIQWSDSNERLIFPVYDLYGNLVMFQGRYFGQAGDKPRYSTKGQVDSCYHILGEPSPSVVVVEDAVSAIKVARVAQVMSLWGSQLSYDRIIKLSNRFEELVVWLDRDKANYALRAHLKASLLFDRVRVVITNKDPKEYNETEIRKHLGQHASPIGFH